MKTAATVGMETFAQTLEAFRNGEGDSAEISRFIGISEAANRIRARIELAASVTEKHILITGETGSGKSLAAQLIHDLSDRKEAGRFLAINCSAIPADLVESELFGHEAGSFTGAINKQIGFFERADRGTLFLDEIGEATLAVQVKLLRVIETSEFYRVGGTMPLRVNTRVIAATNLELGAAIREKKFRTDLYYRLYGIGLHVPPLRDRLEDLSYIAASFVAAWEKKRNGGAKYTFQDSAIEKLYTHPWPGNVRELRAVMENAMLLCGNQRVLAEHIEFPLIHS